MGDSEEEIDYMSADFLTECTGTNDVRPGLVYSHAAKRKISMEKKKKAKDAVNKVSFRPVKEVQKERLEAGLNTALNSSNKGFSLLEKMGYKPGTSLGKEGQGRLEPVSVDLKHDRVGLGWQQMIADYKKKKEERKIKKRIETVVDPEEYRARKRNERQEKTLMYDLRKCRRICYEMDSKQNITEPEEKWFWPFYTQEYDEEEECEEDEEEDDDEFDIDFEPHEKLMVITTYLRTQYLYCLWCGTVFDDERDLKQNCPGLTREDHDDDDV